MLLYFTQGMQQQASAKSDWIISFQAQSTWGGEVRFRSVRCILSEFNQLGDPIDTSVQLDKIHHESHPRLEYNSIKVV